jgi:DNA-binding transcriptional LysR family regulator
MSRQQRRALAPVSVGSMDAPPCWHLVYPSSGQPSRKVIAFRDFLVDHLAKVRLD